MKQMIDIGINLMHKSFHTDREQVLERAAQAGVSPLILTGTSVRASKEAANYAAQFPGKLYSTAGVHPHDAKSCNQDTIKVLRELAARPEVVAIGECGLDFNRDFSPRDVQERVFRAQIELALELNMPLFLHERDAHQRFIEILAEYEGKIAKAVVHCFTGDAIELAQYLKMGCFIGITGWICDERRGQHLRELVKRIPLNKLMIETDAPFLTPRDLRPKPADGRNEPSFLPHILRTIAKCMGKTEEEVAAVTTENAQAFFGLT